MKEKTNSQKMCTMWLCLHNSSCSRISLCRDFLQYFWNVKSENVLSHLYVVLTSCWLETGIQILDLYFHKLINYIEYPNDMINESNIICIDQFASVRHRNKKQTIQWQLKECILFFQLHHCINWELHFIRRQINDDFTAILWLIFIHDHFSFWNSGTNDII